VIIMASWVGSSLIPSLAKHGEKNLLLWVNRGPAREKDSFAGGKGVGFH